MLYAKHEQNHLYGLNFDKCSDYNVNWNQTIDFYNMKKYVLNYYLFNLYL